MKPPKTSTKKSPKPPPVPPPWWDRALLPRQNVMRVGPIAMLLNHALTTGGRILTGACKSLLMGKDPIDPRSPRSPWEGPYNQLISELAGVVRGQVLYRSRPILGYGPVECWITWETGAITSEMSPDGLVSLNIATLEPEMFQAVKSVLVEHLATDDQRRSAYVLTQGSGGPGLSEFDLPDVPFEWTNYAPEVQAAFHRIQQDLESSSPRGRLSIIEGEPGTGKTWLVRGLIQSTLAATFILLPSHLMLDLAGPTLIPTLLAAKQQAAAKNQPIVLILEDADNCLTSRSAGADPAAVSALLNLSDGILGGSLDIRVVCTTNLGVQSIDPALLRPSRLNEHVTITALAPGHAENVYLRLSGGVLPTNYVFDTPLTLAQIYRLHQDVLLSEEGEDEGEDET